MSWKQEQENLSYDKSPLGKHVTEEFCKDYVT